MPDCPLKRLHQSTLVRTSQQKCIVHYVENGHDNRTHRAEFVVRFWFSLLIVDPQEMEPLQKRKKGNGALSLAKRQGYSNQVSDALLFLSEPWYFTLLHGEVAWALRGFYPALKVLNLRLLLTPVFLLTWSCIQVEWGISGFRPCPGRSS